MYGYKISKNGIEIDKENALVVRLIFQQYANGIGYTKISKMLNEIGVKTLRGGKWTVDSVRSILFNEKYAGNSLFQKSFVDNHLTKKQKRNHGELPKFYAEGTHEPIIDKALFNKVHEILEKNREKTKTNKKVPQRYAFTGKIKCGICGANYKHKIKNKKSVWICSTFNSYGKSYCASRQISESILEAKAAEVLKLSEFNEDKFKENIRTSTHDENQRFSMGTREPCYSVIERILVPEQGTLLFCFKNGEQIKTKWNNSTRSESWTEEKRQKAREKALNFLKKESKA